MRQFYSDSFNVRSLSTQKPLFVPLTDFRALILFSLKVVLEAAFFMTSHKSLYIQDEEHILINPLFENRTALPCTPKYLLFYSASFPVFLIFLSICAELNSAGLQAL